MTDYERQFRAMIYDARHAIDAFEDTLDQDSVTREEFLHAIRQLDRAGILSGWDGPDIDRLAEELDVREV
jgi:hypothetical protein